MRKNFLVLMLLSLLPLAGWAQTDVNVRAKVYDIEYGKANPTAVVKEMLRLSVNDHTDGRLATAIAGKLNITTTREVNDLAGNETKTYEISLKLAGDDIVMVDVDDDGENEEYAINITSNTAAIRTVQATAEKSTVSITGAPVFKNATLTYSGNPQSLVTDESIAPAAFYGTINALTNLPMEFSVDGGTTWQDNAQVTNAQTTGYTLQYRIKGADNYAESLDAAKGTVTGTKAVYKDAVTITAGTLNTATLTYDGDEKALLTAAASVNKYADKVTILYSVDKENGTYPETYAALADKDNYAEVVMTNAGSYKIKYDLSAADKENLTVEAVISDEITIGKANAIVTAPVALKPSFTNANQPLISTGSAIEGATIKYCTTNSSTPGDWTTTIPTGKFATGHQDGGDETAYTAWYKVAGDDVNGNWDAVEPTQISGVTIEKAIVTVKVNNITKVYDGTTSLANATIDGGNAKFDFITLQAGNAAIDYAAVPYSTVEAENANNSAYVGVVTVAKADLTAVNDNYDYYVQPGNLTINKSQLTITAQTTDSPYGTANAEVLADQYTIKDQNNADVDVEDAFVEGHFPVLVSTDAAAAEYKPGTYNVAFTEGTVIAGGNYEVAQDGYVVGAAKFIIGKAAQVVITVIPKQEQYGTTENWNATPVEGTDYYVANLLPGSEIETITLTREGYAENEFDVDTYALTATATVTHPDWYNGEIIFNNSTYEIIPRKLHATIDQQTIVKDVPAGFDNSKWDVDAMQFDQNKSVLGATLALVDHAAETVGTKTVAAHNGISLTITNPNYVLDGENVYENKAYGQLIVIEANSIALQTGDADLLQKLQTAEDNGSNYTVTFAGETRKMDANKWYAIVLPFNTSAYELVKNLKTYVLINTLSSSSIDASGVVNVKFGVHMGDITAGTPFLIKPATELDWTTADNFIGKAISASITPATSANADFLGTYETGKSVQWGYDLDGNAEPGFVYDGDNTDWGTTTLKYRYLNTTAQGWANIRKSSHSLDPMEAYLKLASAATGSRIFVEDMENGTTAIKSLGADEINGLKIVDGWYTLDGVKLQGAPTQKGIYINNGKKVVVK